MTSSSDTVHHAAGVAALAICESLLLALGELKILRTKDANDVLEDAAAVHRDAACGTGAPDVGLHRAVAAIIDRMLAGRSALPPA